MKKIYISIAMMILCTFFLSSCNHNTRDISDDFVSFEYNSSALKLKKYKASLGINNDELYYILTLEKTKKININNPISLCGIHITQWSQNDNYLKPFMNTEKQDTIIQMHFGADVVASNEKNGQGPFDGNLEKNNDNYSYSLNLKSGGIAKFKTLVVDDKYIISAFYRCYDNDKKYLDSFKKIYNNMKLSPKYNKNNKLDIEGLDLLPDHTNEATTASDSVDKTTQQGNTTKEKSPSIKKPKSEKQKKTDYIKSCKLYDYKKLKRYEDKYYGKRIAVRVHISQVLNDGGTTWYRAYEAVNGDYDLGREYTIIDNRIDDSPKLLKGDIISVYGKYIGLNDVTRAIDGVSEEVPAIDMKYVKLRSE